LNSSYLDGSVTKLMRDKVVSHFEFHGVVGAAFCRPMDYPTRSNGVHCGMPCGRQDAAPTNQISN
jgi:hypothetical protein